MNIKQNKIYLSFYQVLGYAIIAIATCIITVDALKLSIDVPTFHLDGAFQTASSLFRLDSGQLPGKDFYPYLGIGPILAIFPIYKFVGADLAATVFAAKFTTILFSWLGVTIIWHLVLRPLNLLYSLAGGALILFGVDFVSNQVSIQNFVSFAVDPGNSLRPIRSILPYFISIMIYFSLKKITNKNLQNILIGCTLGVSLMWSNDFAIPTYGVFLFFTLCYFYCVEKLNWKINILIITFISIITWFFLLYFITAGYSIELLKYNFFDVARDQWWYFGPYESAYRIFEVSHLLRIFSYENYFPILVGIVMLILAIKCNRIEYFLVLAIGLSLFAGGSLASVGGHLGGYFGGFFFWGFITSIIIFFNFLVFSSKQIKILSTIKFYFLLFPTLVSFIYILIFTIQDYKQTLSIVKTDQNKFFVSEFGGYLDVSYREYIQFARQNSDQSVIEDYWGLWNSLNRKFPPWPVDSIIHALGNVRERSKLALENVDFVITTRHATSPIWQPWNISQNFWFYTDLISNWEPKFVSPTTIVWSKLNSRREFETVECLVSSDKMSITINPGSPGFYRIKLSYDSSSVRGGGRYLLMFKNNISYGADAKGFVSLQPGSHHANLPLLIEQDRNNKFYLKAVGYVSVQISSCVAEKILYENEELLNTRTSDDFYLTDKNWINGIARHFAGFFTKNSEINRSKFKVGSSVTFSNSEKRIISAVTEYGPYLNVQVHGDILKPMDVGLPNKFEASQ